LANYPIIVNITVIKINKVIAIGMQKEL